MVSCGGGAALRQENTQITKERGRWIALLTATPVTVYQRVKRMALRPTAA
ncbi:MAG: shikimate kinase [Eubacterium ramulus]